MPSDDAVQETAVQQRLAWLEAKSRLKTSIVGGVAFAVMLFVTPYVYNTIVEVSDRGV